MRHADATTDYYSNGLTATSTQLAYPFTGVSMDATTPPTVCTSNCVKDFMRTLGRKEYELVNHLGNVLVTVTDKRLAIPVVSTSNVAYYTADVQTYTDYYAFGAAQPGRVGGSLDYRYGFNGKENDPETHDGAATQDYGMRMYDPRIGRFFSVDPLAFNYPYYTPYQFAGNMPIRYIDLDGGEPTLAGMYGDLNKEALKTLKASDIKMNANFMVVDQTMVGLITSALGMVDGAGKLMTNPIGAVTDMKTTYDADPIASMVGAADGNPLAGMTASFLIDYDATGTDIVHDQMTHGNMMQSVLNGSIAHMGELNGQVIAVALTAGDIIGSLLPEVVIAEKLPKGMARDIDWGPGGKPTSEGKEITEIDPGANKLAGPKPGSAGGPGAGKAFSKSIKIQARAESSNTCVFCGKNTTSEAGVAQSNIDHSIPKSRGGNNTIDNAQNTCRTCNLKKGAKTTEEYLKSKQK